MEQVIKRIIKKGNRGNSVKEWQTILNNFGYKLDVDGYFGSKTEAATIHFQEQSGLMADGKVGKVTLALAMNFLDKDGFKANNVIKTEEQLLEWISKNLGLIIRKAINNSDYTEDWLGAIAARETGFLIIKYVNKGLDVDEISKIMKGDYRRGRYNGFGFWQIDIGSFPAFVESGLWKNPFRTAQQAIICLEGKRYALREWRFAMSADEFERAVTAAYNCGESRVIKALENGYDVDRYTFNKDYSAEVFRIRNKYKSIIEEI